MALLMFTPQILVWHALYGSWFVIPRGSGYEQVSVIGWQIPVFIGSIFTFSPILLPAVIGLFWWRNSLTLCRRPCYAAGDKQAGDKTLAGLNAYRFPHLVAPAFAVVLLVIVVLAGGSRDWMLGTAFGQRRIVDWAPCLAVGLGVYLTHMYISRKTHLISMLIVGLAAANGVMIVLYLLGALPEYGRVVACDTGMSIAPVGC
jgi:hypothetical protein